MNIYHVVLPEVWDEWKDRSYYEAPSLESEGFIHCSFEDQLAGVLKRYYSGVQRVVILTIDSTKLHSKLVAEPSTNDEMYPHIYGPINLDAVEESKLVELSNSASS